jgi:hypothetical protein
VKLPEGLGAITRQRRTGLPLPRELIVEAGERRGERVAVRAEEAEVTKCLQSTFGLRIPDLGI